TRGSEPPRSPFRSSAAQLQALDQRTVTLHVDPHQVVEQPTPAPDQQQQPASGVVVLLVRLQVLGQSHNAPGEQCHLGLGGAGVRLVQTVVGQDRFLFRCGQRHVCTPLSFTASRRADTGTRELTWRVPCHPHTTGQSVSAATDYSRTQLPSVSALLRRPFPTRRRLRQRIPGDRSVNRSAFVAV